MLSLNVEKRIPDSKRLYTLRRDGKVPAVYYGAKQDSTPVTVSEIDFMKIWHKVGESSVIILKDGKEDHEALIHEVVVDPVTDKVLHADFYVIEKGKKVKVNIPLEFVGNSPAVKTGGILVKVLHEVEAKPADLPHNLEVDISSLVDFSSQIIASDIKLPAGVELVTKDTEVVALVSEAKEEVLDEPVVPVDFASAVEVEKKGKKEEEGAEDADGAKAASPAEKK